MPVKDYYKLLQIEPHADAPTIKKAFRKLAMQYHPDKHANNPNSTSFFRELQIAYETLSDAQLRENYHYQRWLEKSKGFELDSAIHPEQLIQQFIHAERAIHEMDAFRTDKSLLCDMLLKLYTPSRIALILEKDDANLERTTIGLAMQSSCSLPSTLQLNIIEQLNDIVKRHPDLSANWMNQLERIKKREQLDKLKLPLLITITIILCLLILLISK